MTDLDVVWSGTLDTARIKARQVAPPGRRMFTASTVQGVIAEFLQRGGRWTRMEIADVGGYTRDQVNVALWNLQRRGEVGVEGRKNSQRYYWR